MGLPIAPTQGIAFAFPDVCKTPAPPAPPIPIPYPNIAQLNQAEKITNEPNKELLVGPSSLHVLLLDSAISQSTGDEAGSVGGVKSGKIKGECKITKASQSVVYGPNKKGIARFLDTTSQNNENATGIILGSFPTVLVGD
jgi:hypothetical protein